MVDSIKILYWIANCNSVTDILNAAPVAGIIGNELLVKHKRYENCRQLVASRVSVYTETQNTQISFQEI